MPNTDNGRATLAKVIAELAAQDRRAEEHYRDIKADIGEVKVCVTSVKSRMRDVEREQTRNEEQHKSIRREMDDQANDTKRFSAIVSSVEAIGVFLGSIFFGRVA